MPDKNEYSGSGSFVGDFEPEAPKAAKKSSVTDRQIVKNNGATVADAKNVDQTQVGKDALAISDALGNPEPPIGSVLYGVAKEVAPYVLGGLGLKAAWDLLSSNKSQTSNDGANGGWGKTIAGKPENATLGAPAPQATTVPAAATTAAPIPETAPAPNVMPEGPAAPPAGTVEKPIDPVQQAKIDSIKAANERAAEAHANEQRRKDNAEARSQAAHDAKLAVQAEAKSQKSPSGKPFEGDALLEIQSKKNAVAKSIDAEAKLNAIKSAPANVPPVAAAPVVDMPSVAATPTATPPAPSAPIAEAVTPVVESKAPVIPNAEVAAAAEKTLKTRRSSAEVAAENEAKPYNSAKRSILSYLGAKESPEMDAKARSALGVLKEKVYGGEKIKQTGAHINEQWAKGKAYILAHPEEFAPEIVERQKKSGEQLKSEASAKKSAKSIDSQRGGINVDAVAEAGGKVAGAVKPVLNQTGALVGSELKGAAAMLPFMLATDVGAQNTGYRRELEQQLKTERNVSRAAELQAEIQKLDEDKYINAMKRRYVDKNIPAQLRPQQP